MTREISFIIRAAADVCYRLSSIGIFLFPPGFRRVFKRLCPLSEGFPIDLTENKQPRKNRCRLLD